MQEKNCAGNLCGLMMLTVVEHSVGLLHFISSMHVHVCCRDCRRYGRMQQLVVLRAVYELAGDKIMHRLRNDYDIDTTGAYVAASLCSLI